MEERIEELEERVSELEDKIKQKAGLFEIVIFILAFVAITYIINLIF